MSFEDAQRHWHGMLQLLQLPDGPSLAEVLAADVAARQDGSSSNQPLQQRLQQLQEALASEFGSSSGSSSTTEIDVSSVHALINAFAQQEQRQQQPPWNEIWGLIRELHSTEGGTAVDTPDLGSLTSTSSSSSTTTSSSTSSNSAPATQPGTVAVEGFVADVASRHRQHLSELMVTPVTPPPYPGE